MSSIYKKRLIREYWESRLEQTLHVIRQGNLTIIAAGRIFSLPRSTLKDRLNGKHPEGPVRMGADTVLAVAEERKLIECLTDLVKCVFPRKVVNLLNTLQRMLSQITGRAHRENLLLIHS